MTTPKRIDRKKWEGFAILNAYGDPWTRATFYSKFDAEDYMREFWKDVKNAPMMSQHTIVEVEIRVLPPEKEKKTKKLIPQE